MSATLTPGVKTYLVDICDGCYELRGETCHEPGCVFCRRSTAEVARVLDATLIRPVVDGERLRLGSTLLREERTPHAPAQLRLKPGGVLRTTATMIAAPPCPACESFGFTCPDCMPGPEATPPDGGPP